MKKSTYSKLVPKLISNNVDNFDEVARWVLDRNRIAYDDNRHGPGLYALAVNRATGLTGIFNQPAWVMTDSIVNRALTILSFTEDRCPPAMRLIPEDPDEKQKVLGLVVNYQRNLMGPVTGYAYSILLPHRKLTLPVFKEGIPLWEKIVFTLFYGTLAQKLSEGLSLTPDSTETNLAIVRKAFAEAAELLSDGRPFLAGDKFTAADIMFSSNAAPMVLPDQFGGAGFRIDGVPEAMRKVVEEMRETPAGKHILKMYAEERIPVIPAKDLPNEPFFLTLWLRRLRQSGLVRCCRFSSRSRRAVRCPVGRSRDGLTVNGYEPAREVLKPEGNFSPGLPDARWEAVSLSPFPDRDLVGKVVKPEDPEKVGSLVRARTEELTNLAKPFGQLDVVESFARVAALWLANDYLGVPSPDWPTMRRWSATLFDSVFTSDDPGGPDAKRSSSELNDYLKGVIADRREGTDDPNDDVLGRLLALPELDDEAVRKTIGAMLVSSVEPVVRSVALATDELLRRPEALAKAASAALSWDTDTVRGYVHEALRFNPPALTLERLAEKPASLGGHEIAVGGTAAVELGPVLFDRHAFPNPKEFDPARSAEYPGLHQSIDTGFGAGILDAAITELVSGVLRLPSVGRDDSGAGHLRWNGLNPNNLVVKFEE